MVFRNTSESLDNRYNRRKMFYFPSTFMKYLQWRPEVESLGASEFVSVDDLRDLAGMKVEGWCGTNKPSLLLL